MKRQREEGKDEKEASTPSTEPAAKKRKLELCAHLSLDQVMAEENTADALSLMKSWLVDSVQIKNTVHRRSVIFNLIGKLCPRFPMMPNMVGGYLGIDGFDIEFAIVVLAPKAQENWRPEDELLTSVRTFVESTDNGKSTITGWAPLVDDEAAAYFQVACAVSEPKDLQAFKSGKIDDEISAWATKVVFTQAEETIPELFREDASACFDLAWLDQACRILRGTAHNTYGFDAVPWNSPERPPKLTGVSLKRFWPLLESAFTSSEDRPRWDGEQSRPFDFARLRLIHMTDGGHTLIFCADDPDEDPDN